MLEALLLVLSLCVDACVASFAYGTDKIKIPLSSSMVLTGISTLFLAISLSIGSILQSFMDDRLTHILCFVILFLLGFLRLFEGVLKNYLNQKAKSPHNIELTLFNFKLVLNVYVDVTLADVDHSKSLSIKEALYLGIVLSLDSLLVGLGAALTSFSFGLIIFLSIIINFFAIFIGGILGRQCAKKTDFSLSWISGAIIICLAFLKLF